MLYTEALRHEYDLDENSIVFDLGACEGIFINNIYEKYKCNIYGFEPVPSIFKKAQKKFAGIEKIKLFNFGLLDRNFETTMKDQGMSSSLFGKPYGGEPVSIRDINEVLLEFDRIDLFQINIEGGEYDLLEHLLNNGDVTILKNIQIQYHTAKHNRRQNCYTNTKKLIKEITNKLHKTHNLKWCFPVWESWKIKTK